MISVILGNPFFKKHYFTIDPKNNVLHLTNLMVQLNRILPGKSKNRYKKKVPKVILLMTKKIQLAPESQVRLECILAKISDQYQSCTGLIIPSHRLRDQRSIALTSSLNKIDDNGKVSVSAIIFTDNQVTLSNRTETAHFEICKGAQADDLNEIDPQLISLAKMRNPHDFEGDPNQVIDVSSFQKFDTSTGPHFRNTRNFRFQLQRIARIFVI